MPTSPNESQQNKDNTYVIDSESAAEMARLMRQDQLLTIGMGGLFPERDNLDTLSSILDIACGPGGWVLETAFQHKDKDVTGVDISQKMIAYAQAQAKVQGLENAHFQAMNALKPLSFADESFDLVNARTIIGFMLPAVWPSFLQECKRILKPGGIFRLTEAEWTLSNLPAIEQFGSLFSSALWKAGQSFSPDGLHLGIQPVMPRLLRRAGFDHIERRAHSIDFSYGTDGHESLYQDLKIGFKLMQPFLTKFEVASQPKVDALYQQVMEEMQSEDFCACMPLLTVWGTK